ncbi:MAG TPA: hypothetical protein VJ486_13625, partial [Geothrix sp.]|nr:hypothetical protein [Geothrix sp.]
MRSRLLPILILLISLFSCGGNSKKSGGGGSPIIYDFRPGRANLNPGTSTLLLANFVGGTATIDQGIGPVTSGVPIPVSPSKTTVYTLTVRGESGDPATANTTISVGPMSVSITPSAVSVVTGQSQLFTPAVIGLSDPRLTWSAEGGTIDSNGVFVAGNTPGAYVIGAQSVADPTLCAKAFVTVLPSPMAIAISVNPPATAVTSGQSITLTAQITPSTVNGSVTWTTTAGTITQNGVFSAPNTTGPVTVTATSQIDPTKSASTTFDIVAPPVTPVVTAPAFVTAGQAGYFASVPAQTRSTYAWTVTGGSIQGSATGASITFTPGASGTANISCIVTNAAGTSSAAGAAACAIVPAPVLPVITFPAFVTANQSGYTASIPPQPAGPVIVPAAADPTYAWSISGGTLQSPANGTSITFTAGPSGTVLLSCVVTNAAGTSSPAGTASCAIIPPPSQPVITAPATLTLGLAGYTASVPAQSGNTYAWSITNGSIQGSTTGTSISFTAGATGTATGLSCTVTNAAGTVSTPGTASCALVAAPLQPVVTAPSTLTTGKTGYTASIPAQAGTTYAWSITNGSIQGSTTGTSISFTAGIAGTPTRPSCVVTNAAGTASAPGTTTCTVVAVPNASLANNGPVNYGATANLTPSFTGGTGVITPTLPGNPTITSGSAIPTAALTTATTFTLTVTNAAGDTAAATTTVNVTPVVVAAISPATANVTTGNTQAFTATVSGAANTTLTWAVDGLNGGSAAVGTISAAGLYTAGTTAGAHTIRATANADGTTNQTATATVFAAPVATSLAASSTTPLYGATVTLTPTFTGGTATIGTTGLGSSDISASAT